MKDRPIWAPHKFFLPIKGEKKRAFLIDRDKREVLIFLDFCRKEPAKKRRFELTEDERKAVLLRAREFNVDESAIDFDHYVYWGDERKTGDTHFVISVPQIMIDDLIFRAGFAYDEITPMVLQYLKRLVPRDGKTGKILSKQEVSAMQADGYFPNEVNEYFRD